LTFRCVMRWGLTGGPRTKGRRRRLRSAGREVIRGFGQVARVRISSFSGSWRAWAGPAGGRRAPPPDTGAARSS
jgi:hypothetical protein